MNVSPSFSDRFWAKVDRSGECWLWTGSVGKPDKRHLPYGQIRAAGSGSPMVAAHRASWFLHNGAIPRGTAVLHRCDNPRCVRPDHLFLGTPFDNNADKAAKGRSTKGWHVNTGSHHPKALLTDDDVRAIRGAYDSGESPTCLAAEYGVGRSTISNIGARRRWQHLV